MRKPDPERAKNFAAVQHGGQTYNDEVPYEVHLEKVVGVAKRFGFTGDAFVCACWLHDVLEDTRTKYSQINDRFGLETAELVFAVTNEQGRNRAERSRKTYPKTRSAGPMAIALKLCDRIANVEYGLADGTGKAGMYAGEFASFAAALYDPDCEITKPLWDYLARLLKKTPVLGRLARAA